MEAAVWNRDVVGTEDRKKQVLRCAAGGRTDVLHVARLASRRRRNARADVVGDAAEIRSAREALEVGRARNIDSSAAVCLGLVRAETESRSFILVELALARSNPVRAAVGLDGIAQAINPSCGFQLNGELPVAHIRIGRERPRGGPLSLGSRGVQAPARIALHDQDGIAPECGVPDVLDPEDPQDTGSSCRFAADDMELHVIGRQTIADTGAQVWVLSPRRRSDGRFGPGGSRAPLRSRRGAPRVGAEAAGE